MKKKIYPLFGGDKNADLAQKQSQTWIHLDYATITPNHGLEKKLPLTDMDPLSWGWTMKNNILEPTKTDLAPALEYIIQVIRCSCKRGCGTKHSSCKGNDLTFTPSCTEYNGSKCTNIETNDIDNVLEDILFRSPTKLQSGMGTPLGHLLELFQPLHGNF